MSDDEKDDNVIQFPQLSKLEKALDMIQDPDEPITKRDALLIALTLNDDIRKDVQKSLESLEAQLNAHFRSIESRIAKLEHPGQP